MPHPIRPHQLSSSRPISTNRSPDSPPPASTPRPPHLPLSAHTVDLQNLSDDIQFRKVLATSEHEYRVQQAILARREAQELESVRIQSESQAQLDRARLASLEQAELETLQLVIQRSQQQQQQQPSLPQLLLLPSPPIPHPPLPSSSSHPPVDSLLSPQNEEQERIALELAIALSLNQLDPSSSLPSPIISPGPSTSSSSISSPPPPPPIQPSSSSSHSPSQPHPQIDPSLLNPHQSPVDLPPPYERVLEDLQSEPTTPLSLTQSLPISRSSSIISKTSQGYYSSCQPSNRVESPAHPSHRPRSVFGRPLPPIPVSSDPNPRRHSSTGSQQALIRPYLPHASSSTPPCSNSITRSCSPASSHHTPVSSINHPSQDPFSDRFATQDSHPISPQLAPSIDLSHPSNNITSNGINPATIILAREDQDDRERLTTSQEPSQTHAGPRSSSFSSPDSGSSPPSPLSPSGSSFLSPSDSVRRTRSLSATESFVVNPTPHESVVEGIKYGKIQSLHDLPTSRGQFPDTLILTQYFSESPQDKIEHPLVAIEAWSWDRLLTYLMWHGNSRIEAGPLDITQAEDDGLGSWQAGISVVFDEQEGETCVRLVLELVAGNGDSQWSRNETSKEKRRASLIGSTRSSNEWSRAIRGHTIIHLPKPFITLPIQLSTLATSLHEIRTVASMTGCSSSTSSSLTSTFRSSKNHRMSTSPTINNSEVYARLSKAIKANAKALGEEGMAIHEEEKLLKRSKKLLKRKKEEIVGSLSGSSSHSSSHTNLGNRIYHAHHRHGRDDGTGVDGLGLPLPHGATLVQPWESDWA